MRIEVTKQFKKEYKKLSNTVQRKAQERLNIFLQNPHHPTLNNHFLQGKYEGCRSINITGDYRAIYYEASKDSATFLTIGTHHQLYE